MGASFVKGGNPFANLSREGIVAIWTPKASDFLVIADCKSTSGAFAGWPKRYHLGLRNRQGVIEHLLGHQQAIWIRDSFFLSAGLAEDKLLQLAVRDLGIKDRRFFFTQVALHRQPKDNLSDRNSY